MVGDIVIRTIKIAAVALPKLPVFIPAVLLCIVAVRSQEVALLSEAEPLAARMSPTVVVADAVGNK